ncbi:RICIN domain-containing protein [Dyella nitratireducens]|uniref:Ricin B lectin domain-containing protein n=1 Tax=Dyella nitratireducens TaxID=1849580 RepID=A0ABQ1FQ19_9GAMM|nr:RICIN domain-containing protein [Dyella nitratireducens]GGA26008.1 hypothetical protein GCM10010981_13300 [Dyella nitratireducens]GLQ43606.1 hypothetical protein GCM10007902_34560 [Dyella nitratireducens]
MKHPKLWSAWSSLCLLMLAVLLVMSARPAYAATGTLLTGSTLYPRVVRLQHNAGFNGMLVASTNGIIFQSTNNGASWNLIGPVPAISGSSEYCCATLYELPQQVGALAAGTLMFAATYTVNGTPAIEVYTSTNQGVSWSYHSTPVQRGDSSHGLWEPEFEVANDGGLVMFWSDETDSCCSQKLAQIRTYDGQTWQDETNTVASTVQSDRPGMATVSKLPDGHFFMSYELCGPAACTVFYRTSTDGWNFGDPTNTGTKIATASGQYLEHAPVNVWSPSVISSNGAILLVGQVMYESSGSVSNSNGQVLFVNTNVDGAGNWYTITSPVQVPTAYNNYCPNYSSALLPATDGSNILELASDYNNGGCITYYGSESWNNLPADGSTHVFHNMQNTSLCLDDTGWGTTNGTSAELWDCNALAVQNWTVHAEGGGWYSIQNQYSGLCVDNTGGSTTPGNLVTLWGCVGNANQAWLFMDLGNGTYKLMNQASGSLMLDDTGGSTTHGTQLQIWTDNGLAPQQWLLD